MNELVKALSKFVARDLIFIVGGATVIFSFLYLFDKLPTDEDDFRQLPSAYYLVGAGFAYVVGYGIQELFCMSPFVTTANYFEPPGFVRWLYHRLTREQWQQPDNFTENTEFGADEVRSKIYGNPKSKGEAAWLERLSSLKQVGTTMGPCAIVSAIILIVRPTASIVCAIWERSYSSIWAEILPILITILIAGFGVALICLARVKACQQMRYMAYLNEKLPELNFGIENKDSEPSGKAPE